MSSSSSKSSLPGILGLGSSLALAVAAFIGLGAFAVNLLAAMLFGPKTQVSAPPEVAPPAATVATVAASSPAPAASAAPVDPAVAALLKKGQEIYALCAACHGPDGKALIPNMAPNLAGSAYVNGPNERLGMLVLNGIQFPGTHLGQMIAWKAQLSDEQIAGVLTYIRANFGNSSPPITPEVIAAARAKHGSRETPYSRAELDAANADLVP